jgi:putative effector of murein hydrolase
VIRCFLHACLSLFACVRSANEKKLWIYVIIMLCAFLFQLLNKLVDCCESCYEHYTIGGHPIVVLFFPAVVNKDSMCIML